MEFWFAEESAFEEKKGEIPVKVIVRRGEL